MNKSTIHTITLAGIVALGHAGCVPEEAPVTNPRCTWEKGAIDLSAPHRRYVVDSIEFATTPSEATQVALELDCTEPVRRDNALGQVLAMVYQQMGSDLNGLVAGMVEDGRIVQLLDLQATGLTEAPGVGVEILIGEDTDGDPSDNFSGQETFAVTPDIPSTAMSGTISAGQMVANFGDIPLEIALPGDERTYVLDLHATSIEATIVTEDYIEARVGGAMLHTDVENEFVPIVYSVLADIVANECPGGQCATDTRAGVLLRMFDRDDDGFITFDEFGDNDLIGALLAPDVDLFDESGALRPNQDGIADSLSLAVAITAVPAQF